MTITRGGTHTYLSRMTILMFCILAVAIESGANQTGDNFKRAQQLEKQGQSFRAAETYLLVLRLEPGHRNARTALSRIIDQAIAEKLSSATALEAELKFDEARRQARAHLNEKLVHSFATEAAGLLLFRRGRRAFRS